MSWEEDESREEDQNRSLAAATNLARLSLHVKPAPHWCNVWALRVRFGSGPRSFMAQICVWWSRLHNISLPVWVINMLWCRCDFQKKMYLEHKQYGSRLKTGQQWVWLASVVHTRVCDGTCMRVRMANCECDFKSLAKTKMYSSCPRATWNRFRICTQTNK